jgi:hypothetical protein
LIGIGTSNQLVEDVEGSFFVSLSDNSGLFQQITDDGSSRKETSLVEVQLNEFTETRRVIVSGSLGITECLKNVN